MSWPLHVHGVLIVWVCYALSLFFIMPADHWWTVICHVFILSVPPWYLGRAMAGVYAKKER
jgi:hypothetical protein